MILNKDKLFTLCFMAFAFLGGETLAAEENAASASDKNAANSSLRSYVKEENAEQTAKNGNQEESKTWINNLVTTVAEKGAQVISSNTDNQEPQYRTNASVFDISGVMLRMNTKQTMEAMQKRGYQKNSEKFEIPKDDLIKFKEITDKLDLEHMAKIQFIRKTLKDFDTVIQKKKGSRYDISKQRKESNLKPKEFIYSIGMWDEYLDFVQGEMNKR